LENNAEIRLLRLVIATLALYLAGTSVAAEVQKAARVWRVGVLANEAWGPMDGLRDGLRQLGYSEGHTVVFEYRWFRGQADRLPDLAADLVRLNPDVIVTVATPAVLAAKQATTTIPIVMGLIGDPVGAGIVPSLARPGGNITGVSVLAAELEPKRLELLKQLLPSLSRVGVLVACLTCGCTRRPHERPRVTRRVDGHDRSLQLFREQRKVLRVRGDDSGAVAASRERDQHIVLEASAPARVPMLGIADPSDQISRIPPDLRSRLPLDRREPIQRLDQALSITGSRAAPQLGQDDGRMMKAFRRTASDSA
jgi:putative ABC transport system substrate-binding protein